MSASPQQGRNPETEEDGPSTLCQGWQDFFSLPARQIMRSALAPFMEDHETVPLEVIHSSRLLADLESHPQLNAALSIIADRQASACGQNVTSRLNDLQDLTKQAIQQIGKRQRKHPPQIVSAVEFPQFLSTAKSFGADEDVHIYVYATLSQTLFSCTNRYAKVDMLLGFAERLSDNSAALTYLDELIAEHLATRGCVADLWKQPENPAQMVQDLVVLYRNGRVSSTTTTALVPRLAEILPNHPFPQIRAALLWVVQTFLRSPAKLINSVPGDMMGTQTVMAEIMATADLATALREPTGFLGGKAIQSSLERRFQSQITTEHLQDLTRGKSILAKLRDLFSIQQAAALASDTKPVDDYIRHLVENRDFVGRLSDAVEDVDNRLKALSELQMLVLGSTFPTPDRKRLATMLDRAQYDQIKTTTLFSTLRKESRPPINAVLAVADLAGDGVFTHGKCLTEARELVRRHSRHRDFVRKYLAGQDMPQSAPTEKQGEDDKTGLPPIKNRLKALADRMARAGVEFRDLTAINVLVVEDEESARSYMEMVLHDMGIINVMTAPDGRAALKVFGDFEDGIDLIICDWKMPHMTGIDFLKQVRSVKQKLPFLMVTALATLENVKSAMAHDVTAYIAKPFPPEQLEEKVLLLINRASPEEVAQDSPMEQGLSTAPSAEISSAGSGGA